MISEPEPLGTPEPNLPFPSSTQHVEHNFHQLACKTKPDPCTNLMKTILSPAANLAEHWRMCWVLRRPCLHGPSSAGRTNSTPWRSLVNCFERVSSPVLGAHLEEAWLHSELISAHDGCRQAPATRSPLGDLACRVWLHHRLEFH